jgi:peptide methionine sulfoxide reductase MsrA
MTDDFRVIATKRVQVPANTETYQEIYRVTPGRRLHLTKVEIFFPTGTLSELQVKILWGWSSLAPTDGFAQGDDVKLEYQVDAFYGSQTPVRAYLKNTNPTSARECIITLVGEES